MQPEHARAATNEFLTGPVERVTYHNAETGHCVLRVKARGQRELVTVVAHAAAIGAGEFVQARAGPERMTLMLNEQPRSQPQRPTSDLNA